MGYVLSGFADTYILSLYALLALALTVHFCGHLLFAALSGFVDTYFLSLYALLALALTVHFCGQLRVWVVFRPL